MSSRLTRLFSRTAGQRRWKFGAILAGVIVVPLAVAGLVAGGLASADKRVDTVPALIVNNDRMVTQTAADGTSQPVLAGRLLVTQLTDPKAAGFDWKLSSTADAKKALASGTAYAVLTIPKDFSASITSLAGDDPQQADLRIQTDDAHSYLAGSAAQSVGDGMSTAFGQAITKQYLSGFYANLAGVGTSLTSAAGGATSVSDGVSSLASGLDQLAAGAASAASGASSAASGAAEFSDGVDRYTGGVDALAGGLATLRDGTSQLGTLGSNVQQYTQGVSAAAAGLDALTQDNAAALGAGTLDAAGQQALAARLGTTNGALRTINAGSAALGAGAAGLGQVAEGTAQSAAGAAQLSGGSAGLRSGAQSLASGVSQLSDGVGSLSSGAASSASGAHQLADGASQLASGLTTGAGQASKLGDIDADKTADVVSKPVAVASQRENPINAIGGVIGMIFVPVSLWIGALAVFLLLRPISSTALQSTASTGRLVFRSLARASGIALAQAVLVVALLHTVLGVTWTMLPATLAFAALTALVFAAIHHFLCVAFGRVGWIVSLLLVTLQLVSAGGLYPVQLLAGPYQVLGTFLPLTWAVQGMQQIVAGSGGAQVAAAAGVLVLFGLLSCIGSLIAVSRRRGARSWGFAMARG